MRPWQEQYICESCHDTIETEGVEPETSDWPENHREANLVSRLLAFFIDFVLFTGITVALVWLLHHLLELNQLQTQYLYWVVFYGEFVFRDGLLPGGSPGKRFVGLYVWNDQLDRPVTGIDSVRRNLMLLVFFLDVLLIPFNPERRRVGDYLAHTRVCDRLSRRSMRSDLYRLSGVVFLNVALIFAIYVVWLNNRAQERIAVRKVLAERTVTSENIVSILKEAGRGTSRFEVTGGSDHLVIEAEVTSADRYYEMRRNLTKILNKASYRVTNEERPELVFRGPNNVHFRLRLEAVPGKE